MVSSIVQLCFINCLCIFSIGKDGKDGQHGGSSINMQQFSFIIRLPVRVTLKLSRNEKQIHIVKFFTFSFEKDPPNTISCAPKIFSCAPKILAAQLKIYIW